MPFGEFPAVRRPEKKRIADFVPVVWDGRGEDRSVYFYNAVISLVNAPGGGGSKTFREEECPGAFSKKGERGDLSQKTNRPGAKSPQGRSRFLLAISIQRTSSI